jgi:hypothetical protein
VFRAALNNDAGVSMSMRVALYRIGILCGLAAPIVWAAAIVLCGSLRPGYSHAAQYISELGERGGPTELLMRYAGFVPAGILHVLFAGSLYEALKGDRLAPASALLLALNGLGRVAAGMFPCEAGAPGPGSCRVRNCTPCRRPSGSSLSSARRLSWASSSGEGASGS